MGFTGNNSFGAIQIDGQFASLRMKHVKFTNLSAEGIGVGFNTGTKATFTHAMLLPHDTGSAGQLRGMRIREIFANTFI